MQIGKSKPNWRTNIQGIPIVTSTKYLGITMNECIMIDPHLDHITAKTKILIGKIKAATQDQTAATKLKLFKILVKPHFDYCARTATAICERGVSKLATSTSQALKNMLSIGKSVSNKFIDSILNSHVNPGSSRCSHQDS